MIAEQAEVRYLGISLDARLNSDRYWLYQRSALRFMYSALLCGRAYGTLLEREEGNARTRRVKVLTTAPHPQLKLLPTNSSHLRSLQPHRLREMWNHLP